MEQIVQDAVDRPTNRIAIVEHDPDNRVLMAAMLSPRYDVVAVGRSSDPLGAIVRHRPQVVLWDVGDDDALGPIILEGLRRDPLLGDTAIVAVTASIRRDAARYWLWLGFDGVVAKPILDKTMLWQIIDDLCRGYDPADIMTDRFRCRPPTSSGLVHDARKPIKERPF